MAILIKDMKMPDCCGECRFRCQVNALDTEIGNFCMAQSPAKAIKDTDLRSENCPLEELIYCKDCRKWCICHHSDDYFCADGEGRDDGENTMPKNIDYDPCDECHENGDDYYQDEDGDWMMRCYDCPLWERRE